VFVEQLQRDKQICVGRRRRNPEVRRKRARELRGLVERSNAQE
jgi:hypothetical protein